MRLFPLIAAAAAMMMTAAQAQDYPSRTVTIISPFPPGGAVDLVAREVAQKLTEQTGQSFIVENRTGASGTIGMRAVATAAPDGYTLLAVDTTYAMLPHVLKSMPFDQATALAPITLVARAPVLAGVKTGRFKDINELLTEAKASPDTLTYGTGGAGTTLHYYGALFEQAAGIDLRAIPFKGSGDVVTAMLADEIDMIFTSAPSLASQIQGGTFQALGISGEERLPSMPDVPTFTELGLPYDAFSWTGIAAPAGTPPEIVDKLYAEISKAMESDDMKTFIANMGAYAGGMPPAEFDKWIKDETAKWGETAKAAGLQPQ